MPYKHNFQDSRGRDQLRGRILMAERRVANARYLGWRALEASWQATLDHLLSTQRQREITSGGPP